MALNSRNDGRFSADFFYCKISRLNSLMVLEIFSTTGFLYESVALNFQPFRSITSLKTFK
ncbi:MAG: hypothetical protein CMP20_08735 [Rickettsiales bacterium]|nr:hypothetical protein [Rickettsiales bacterium]